MSIELAPATPEDGPALASILEDGRKFKLERDDNIWGHYTFTPKEVQRRIEEGNTYIATMEGKPVGSFALLWEDSRFWDDAGNDGSAGYLHSLAVADEFRGIGPELIDLAAQEVATAGRDYLRLDCEATNEELCGYYLKHGFKVVGEKTLPPRTPEEEEYHAALFQRPVQP